MAGLVARKFVFDNRYYRAQTNFEQGAIRRLVTLGTPHTGTPLANLLLYQQMNEDCPTDENNAEPGIQNQHIDKVIERLEDHDDRLVLNPGAIGDLAQGSALLQALNSVNQEIPSFALVGNIGQEIELDPDSRLDDWFLVGKIEKVGCEYNDIYGDNNNSDGIVPVVSARGRGTENPEFDVYHTSMTGNVDMGELVVQLLNGPLSTFASFASVLDIDKSEELLAFEQGRRLSSGEGVRSSLMSRVRQLIVPSFLAILGIGDADAHGQSEPSILLSVDSTLVLPGDTLYFSAQVKGNPESPLFLALAQSSWEDDTAPYEWLLDVPITASGTFDYYVLAEVDGKAVKSNVVSVAVVPDASSLVQLTFDPQTSLVLGLSDRKQLSVEGRLNDGFVRDLSDPVTGTVYSERIVDGLQVVDGDSPFISLTADGVVNGLAVGEAEVRAENNGISTVRRVYVEDFKELLGDDSREIQCDINGNGRFDFRDILRFWRKCRKGTATWACDLNEDGRFNWRDVRKYAQHCVKNARAD